MTYKLNKQYRLKGFDYLSNGTYFVTICTKNRINHFGDIIKGEIKLNQIGETAKELWEQTSQIYKNILPDEFVIMPNHVHLLIILNDSAVKTQQHIPKGLHPLKKNSLSSIINHFKGNIKKWCNKNGFSEFEWQPRFYDRVVRNEKEYEKIQEYIYYNPLKWEYDKDNGENLYM